MWFVNMAVKSEVKCGIARRKSSQSVTFCVKEERNASYKKVSSILQKAEIDRTDEEKEMLFSCSEVVKEVTKRIEKRKRVKERLQEIEDPPDLLAEKCQKLAEAVSNSTNLVVYTGAGVSTAACIPDYRGTNGIWTLLQQGKDIGLHDLTQAEPTLTHMALWQLYKEGILKHVVSQNCDGLHLRSGLPKRALSEVHGNMYIEVCCHCKPTREYWRLFDVTEHTGRFNHRTMRRCYTCMGPLVDTIVHFGERGKLLWPLNWSMACQAADKADVILCIGSSLKVLKKYPWLWGMDKPAKKRPKLYIVNLQWTPKDDQAILKISGKCDEVMRQVMSHMNFKIPNYVRSNDPIFSHATSLHPAEMHTATQPLLRRPPGVMRELCADCGDHKVEAFCHCTGNRLLHGGLKHEEQEVSGSCSGSKCKAEIGLYNEEDFSSQELHVRKMNNGNFNVINVGTADSLTDKEVCPLDKNIEDLSRALEVQSLREVCGKSSTMTVLAGDDHSQNQSDNVTLDVESDGKFHADLSYSESVCSVRGLKMDFSTSFDGVLNAEHVTCDQNSLHVIDTIHYNTSTNHQKYCHLVGSDFQSSSSINHRGCDEGTSSIIDSSLHVNEPSPSHNISSLSLQSLVQILTVEHNYSKKPSGHKMNKEGRCTEERNSKIGVIKRSMHSLERDNENKECKHLKTDRSELQSTSLLHLSQSTLPPSTKKSTGTQKTKDEKQICDEEYDFGDTTLCSFCKSNYGSNSCLFYPQRISNFGSQVSVCECCDMDEDNDADDVDFEICKSAHDSTEGKGNSDVTKVSKVPNINPGWYGKGYRKRVKRRRLEKL